MPDIQNLPRNNHFVPRFYLRGFSTDQENIFRLDKTSSEIISLPINRVAVQRNLYTYINTNGEEESLEDVFDQIERLAARVIRKLKNGEQIDQQEKADLSFFLSTKMVRTPAFQTELLASQKEIAERALRMGMRMTPPEHVQEIMRNLGHEITNEEATDVLEFGSDEARSTIQIEFPQEHWIKTMLSLALDICPVFQICNWEIRHSITPFGFLTSDHPFMLIPGEKPDFFGTGLLTPHAKKIIPLAADICLIAHEPQENPILVHTIADKDFFRKINRWVVKNAERYVFTSNAGKIEKIIKLDPTLLIVPKRYSVS